MSTLKGPVTSGPADFPPGPGTNQVSGRRPDEGKIIKERRDLRRRRPAIKKLPPDLRRRKPTVPAELNPWRKFLFRIRNDSQFFRQTVQFAFLLLCAWIGIEFYLFMQWGQSGGAAPFYTRPPGVEGFLPISALMSLVYWLRSGVINDVHPAGLFIFIAIAATGLLLQKSFCSWMCPVGTISESLWKLGRKIFGRNPGINRWIDYPLRSIKYLLLLFFLWSIFAMDTESLRVFLYSPYNKMADVKMYLFFADITRFALWTLVILVVLSVVIKNFWCRYLCPYGALLGISSWLSPLKITRNASTCIDCELCTKACPSSIKVHNATRVVSDECTGCLECSEACPVKETLGFNSPSDRPFMPNWVFGALVVGVFVGITGLAMLGGLWGNGISKEEYLFRFQNIESPLYDHARGQVPEYTPED
jgi:polyferredoxin